MVQRRYDRERGLRYKEWWVRQSGPVNGELIKVPPELWSGNPATRPEVRKSSTS